MITTLSLTLLGMTSSLNVDTPIQRQTHKSDSPPNIIFVFPDQLRKSAIGFYKNEPVLTPNIDRFAHQSHEMSFASNYPVCSPFRAMLMTGQYPFKNGVFANCHSYTAPLNCALGTDSVCWSDILKANGYSLGYVGKWHLDAPHAPYVNTYNNKGNIAWNEWCPPERRHGFDFWYAYGTFDQHTRPMYWSTHALREEFKYVNEYGPKHEVDKAIEFITNKNNALRDSSKPFALVVSMNPPHTGYECVPQKYKDMYANLNVDALVESIPIVPPKGTVGGNFFRNSVKNYYAQITAVDEEFGRLMDFLDSSPYGKNSLVIFTSDHGDCMGMRNHIGKNEPFEESVSVPCFIRAPSPYIPPVETIQTLPRGVNRQPARVTISSHHSASDYQRDSQYSLSDTPHTLSTVPMMSVPDFAPTILGFAGLDSMIPKDWDGYNFEPFLSALPECADTQIPMGQLYIKMTDAHYSTTPLKYPGNTGRRGWRSHTHTYYIERDALGNDKEFLYDRVEDPFMQKNIASENSELCFQYRALTYKALTKYGDKHWKQTLNLSKN